MVSVSVVVAGLLGLSGCGGDKPSGLTAYTPGVSGSSSPTSTSRWTPEQQKVIDGYDRFIDLQTAISSKAVTIDMVKVHGVASEPFATSTMKDIDAALSAGFVQKGKTTNTISSVTSAGETATIDTCLDRTKLNLTNPTHPSAPRWKAQPPSKGTVSLAREGGSWLVAGYEGDKGACVTG